MPRAWNGSRPTAPPRCSPPAARASSSRSPAIEYPAIIKTAVDTCRGKVPIIAGAGGSTRFAIQCAQEAEAAGAHGILLLPHYLTEASAGGR